MISVAFDDTPFVDPFVLHAGDGPARAAGDDDRGQVNALKAQGEVDVQGVPRLNSQGVRPYLEADAPCSERQAFRHRLARWHGDAILAARRGECVDSQSGNRDERVGNRRPCYVTDTTTNGPAPTVSGCTTVPARAAGSRHAASAAGRSSTS